MAIIPHELDGVVVTNEFPLFDIDRSRLEPAYLKYMVQTPHFLGRLSRLSQGASGQNRVKEAAFLSMSVNLPPLAEQRRIAAILDQADALRAKRREVLAHLDTLPQAIFNEMFGGLPLSGATIGDLAKVQGGLQVTAKRSALPVEVPYLRVANVHRARLDLNEVKTLRVTEAELSRASLCAGDLLVVEGHANGEEIGRVALWSGELPRTVHQNHLIRIRPDVRCVHPAFMATWLNSARGARHFRNAGNTTSGLHTISTSVVRAAPMLTAPLSDQLHFAEALREVKAESVRATRLLREADALFQSLQSRAFKGEL